MIIKICGITNASDARCALDEGADWIGLNLVSGPRCISLPDALEILSKVPQVDRVVALVSLTDRAAGEETIEALKGAGVKRLQLYGDVSPDLVGQLIKNGFEIVCVQSIRDSSSLTGFDHFLQTCGRARPTYWLADAFVPGHDGGTGKKANWPILRNAIRDGVLDRWPPMILAGGLSPENVAEAIQQLQPAGVDVSSGVEIEPGKKDAVKIRAFIKAVRLADTQRDR